MFTYILLPAEYKPPGYYQDWCGNSHPCLLIQPWVFTFSLPWLLFSPCFSLPPTLGYYSALGFLFFPPLVIIQPLVFSFSHPWLLSHPRFLLLLRLGFYPAISFSLLPPLSFPPLVIIQPLFFSSSHPWLLFSPWFSLFPTLGYYSALGFLFLPPLVVIQPQVFQFSHPWLLFSPWFSTFSHPRLLSRPRLVFSRQEYTKLTHQRRHQLSYKFLLDFSKVYNNVSEKSDGFRSSFRIITQRFFISNRIFGQSHFA